MTPSIEASLAGGRCMADDDLTGDRARIDVPALVPGGRHDFITPPTLTAEPLAAGLPRSELVVLEDSGHFPYIEQPAAFGDVVRAWLGRLGQQR